MAFNICGAQRKRKERDVSAASETQPFVWAMSSGSRIVFHNGRLERTELWLTPVLGDRCNV